MTLSIQVFKQYADAVVERATVSQTAQSTPTEEFARRVVDQVSQSLCSSTLALYHICMHPHLSEFN